MGASCTSWAASRVAGVAAMVRARHPAWPAARVARWLALTARTVPGVAYGSLDPDAARR